MKITAVLKTATLTIFTFTSLMLTTQSCNTKKTTSAPTVSYQDYYNSDFYHAVQMAHYYPDSKTFADATPRLPLNELLASYNFLKDKSDFDLKEFIETNFDIPQPFQADFKSDQSKTVQEHIVALWD